MFCSHFLTYIPFFDLTYILFFDLPPALCRVFVATWNVGGKPPHGGLNLNDFIPADDHSDMYVLGYVS